MADDDAGDRFDQDLTKALTDLMNAAATEPIDRLTERVARLERLAGVVDAEAHPAGVGAEGAIGDVEAA